MENPRYEITILGHNNFSATDSYPVVKWDQQLMSSLGFVQKSRGVARNIFGGYRSFTEPILKIHYSPVINIPILNFHSKVAKLAYYNMPMDLHTAI